MHNDAMYCILPEITVRLSLNMLGPTFSNLETSLRLQLSPFALSSKLLMKPSLNLPALMLLRTRLVLNGAFYLKVVHKQLA